MIQLVDLEQTAHPGLGCRTKRRSIEPAMFVSLMATEEGRRRPIKIWIRVLSVVEVCGHIGYLGALTVDTFLDLELGDPVSFGPQHILDWSTVHP